jgi:hypothetical protein
MMCNEINGPVDGAARLSGIMEKGRTALDGTCYDGTMAAQGRDVLHCDAPGGFWMSIRPKNGTFYDGTAALNT